MKEGEEVERTKRLAISGFKKGEKHWYLVSVFGHKEREQIWPNEGKKEKKREFERERQNRKEKSGRFLLVCCAKK